MTTRRRPIVLLLASLLALTLTAAPAAATPLVGDGACAAGVPDAPFEDVSDPAFATAVSCAAFWGVLAGTGYDTFDPDAPITRAALSAMVARTLRAAGASLPAPGNAFDDVEGVFRVDVEQLAVIGAVDGVDIRSFQPGQPMSRGELAAVISRAQAWAFDAFPRAADVFPDDDDSPFEAHVDRLATAGIVTGFPDGTFRPTASITRVQAALYVGRWLTSLASVGAISPAAPPPLLHDVPGRDAGRAWALPIGYAFGQAVGDERRAAVERAMRTWDDAVPGVTLFAPDATSPDLVVEFVAGCESSAGPVATCLDAGGRNTGNRLSHATVGATTGTATLRFDAVDRWSTEDPAGADVVTVALHGLGHVLGLGDSLDPGSSMGAVHRGTDRSLADVDVAAVRALYADGGPSTAPLQPPPTGPTTPGMRSVVAGAGPSAQGQPGCSSTACRFLVIDGFGFVPASVVTASCEVLDGGAWRRFGFSDATVDANGRVQVVDCYYGFPGRTVRGLVDGVASTPVTWPAG